MNKKEALFEAARRLFLEHGFKEVNVSEITKAAGVAVGSFYNYYPSKENLFLGIYEQENERVKRSIGASLNPDDCPDQIAQEYLLKCMSALSNNQILSEWYRRDISKDLQKRFQENDYTERSFLREFLHNNLPKWRADKKIREDIDNETVQSLFNVLIYLDIHHDEMNIPDFPRVIQLFAEFVIKGLAPRPDGSTKEGDNDA